MGLKILIDADVLVYHSSFACQKHRYKFDGIDFDDYATLRDYLKGQDLKPNEVEYEKILDVLDEDKVDIVAGKLIEMISDQCESFDHEFYLSGDTNFRTELATIQPYKGNRQSDKPVHFDYAKRLFTNMATAISDNEEADDLLAQRQHQLGYTAVIASIDKDLNMIPGKHFDWNKMIKYKVSVNDADRWFWTQMLTGDKADNIPGITRCGPVTAEKILAECSTSEERADAVLRKYQKQYGALHAEVIDEVGRLLWMRRRPGELWSYSTHQQLSNTEVQA